ncbi:uncharacterized protein [Battus philenor]|uniref:uncharacterized protein n=1 Tax=Battus philenor TaxID=42288 RepID=UPI0035CF0776
MSDNLMSKRNICEKQKFVTTVSCAEANSIQHRSQGLMEEKARKLLSKRDSGVVIRHFLPQPFLKHGPKLIYKRISNSRYRSPKPSFTMTRARRRQTNPSRKVMRKYRKSVNPKYGPPRHHKRPPKISYANPKVQNYKPLYSLLKRSPNFVDHSVPSGFGEPPDDYYLDHNFLKSASYKSPEIHSQVNKVNTASKEHVAAHKLSDAIDLDDQDYQIQELKSWKTVYLNDFDDNFSASKTGPSLVKSEYEKPSAHGEGKNSYSDIFKYEKRLKMGSFNNKKNKKRAEKTRYANRPMTRKNPINRQRNEIVVGGRYAEPPGRYLPTLHKGTLLSDDEDFALPEAVDSEVPSSATISPYVNYKNSNLAFSPQNLNDAFSIVD